MTYTHTVVCIKVRVRINQQRKTRKNVHSNMFLGETNTHTLTYTCCKSFPVLWLILFLIHNVTQLLLLQHLLLILQIPTIFVQFFLYLTFIRPYVHICSYILCCNLSYQICTEKTVIIIVRSSFSPFWRNSKEYIQLWMVFD